MRGRKGSVMLTGEQYERETTQLYRAILTLKTQEECRKFFEDLCTANELQSIAQRLEVASLLRQNRTYLGIADDTGASTATISRVNRSLTYGNGGYEIAFGRIESQ